MPMHAKGIKATKAYDDLLRWHFLVQERKDMMTIAAAFARAVLPQPDVPKAVRIGLDSQGYTGVGKSTFAAAMVSAFAGKQSVEKNHDFRPQDVW